MRGLTADVTMAHLQMEENNGHSHLPQYDELGHCKADMHPEPAEVDGIDDIGHLQLSHTVR